MPHLRRNLPALALMALAALLAVHARAQTPGLVPLTDLGAGTYAGFSGGLYPGGLNAVPAPHLASALAAAAQVVPRDAAGLPDANGWIGMIALGMSNTTHEFGAFERNADRDTTRHARVVIMDTGQGGQTATILANPNAAYWTVLAQRVAAMGLTPAQVQVAWLKEAEANPPNNFPLHAQALRDTLARVVQVLHQKYPNVRLCYLSSRIYGGYSAQGGLNPEPQAYESGFSVKWLIERQITGDADVNADPLAGTVRSPWLLWGPYLWANGPSPRADGLTWPIGDLEGDHVHPSPSGEQKVARLLADFFASDTTAAPWWRARPGVTLRALDATDDATVSSAAPAVALGTDTLLTAAGGATPQNVFLRFDATGVTEPVLMAKLSMRVFSNGGGIVRLVNDVSWNENTITWGNAPSLGASLVQMPNASRDGTFGAQVTSAYLSDADRLLSFATTLPGTGPATYHSREGQDPPRLVLVVSSATVLGAGDGARAPGLQLATVPNPALGATRVSFVLSQPRAAHISVHAIDGRLVRVLHEGLLPAGSHSRTWDGADSAGRPCAPGVYLVRVQTADGDATGRVVRLR